MNSGRLYRKICTREGVSELELVLESVEVLVLGSVVELVLVLEMFELV